MKNNYTREHNSTEYDKFEDCDLEMILIPESVTAIGENIFGEWGSAIICGKLGTTAHTYAIEHGIPFMELSAWSGGTWSLSDGTLTIEGEGTIEYDRESPWRYLVFKNLVIGEGITGIGRYVFSSNSLLECVTLPKSLEIIGRNAFGECTNLTEIQIPDNVEKIGPHAFAGCSKLESVEIDKGITKLPRELFRYDKNLKNIKLSSESVTVGRNALEGTGVTQIPGNVTSIAYAAFASCTALEKINLQNVEKVGSYAFADCKELRV